MQIERITTQQAFDVDFAQLAVWTFGPLVNLPRDEEDEADESDVVLLARENGRTVGYLTADSAGVWCVEVRPEARGRGIARSLVKASGARAFCEVCTDDGAALAEALGLEWEDAR
jgi:ribosomal protein S18 acetylase RimI-like enzyme